MDDLNPPHEWRPGMSARVVDDRPDSRGRRGTVTAVEVGGPHFADRDYWIDVRWDDGRAERRIASHWLYREDGTQAPPDPTAFLLARLDEDEQVALAANGGGRWHYSDGDSVGAWTLYDEHWRIGDLKTYKHETYDYATRMPAARNPGYVDADANGRHIARFDPGRMLIEVVAKRKRIAWLTGLEHELGPETFPTYDSCRILWTEDMAGDEPTGYCSCGLDALRAHLFRFEALSYADHPDYRGEWAPE